MERRTTKTRILKFALAGYVLLNVAFGLTGLALKRIVKTMDDPLADVLSLPAIFGGTEFTSHATSLRCARIVVFAGGALIDFSEAEVDSAGLDIEATTFTGGIDIVVPRNCRVVLEATTFMGGTQAPALEHELPAGAPQIRVRCTTIMGGLNVRYAEDDGGGGIAATDLTPEPEPVAVG